MRGKWIMYVDQYGNAISASSVRELCRRAGYARGGAKLMYCDKKDGTVVRTGYIVGRHWFMAYVPYEVPA